VKAGGVHPGPSLLLPAIPEGSWATQEGQTTVGILGGSTADEGIPAEPLEGEFCNTKVLEVHATEATDALPNGVDVPLLAAGANGGAREAFSARS
jgi:hypothetical protein